jgi:hypothetical protein
MAFPVEFLFKMPRAKGALKLWFQYSTGRLIARNYVRLRGTIMIDTQAPKVGATIIGVTEAGCRIWC